MGLGGLGGRNANTSPVMYFKVDGKSAYVVWRQVREEQSHIISIHCISLTNHYKGSANRTK